MKHLPLLLILLLTGCQCRDNSADKKQAAAYRELIRFFEQ
jgi:hypothetical protein